MGNRKSQPNLKVCEGFQPSQWKFCSSTSQYEIIANVRSGQMAEVHQISLDPTVDYAGQLHKYQYRRTQKQNLVQVLNVQRSEDDFQCSARVWIKVIIERIPYRLSQIKNITPQQGLYVLKRALIGFKAIQQLNGCMRIDDNLICINPQGRVKVWLNDDLASNQPQEGRLLGKSDNPQQAQNNQISMVNQIVKEVWLHVSPGLRHSNFMDAYKEECRGKSDNGISFFEVLNFLEDYIVENGIQFPDGVRMPNKVHQFNNVKSDNDSESHKYKNYQESRNESSRPSFREEQGSPRFPNNLSSQKTLSNAALNKNIDSKLSTGVSTGASINGVPAKAPQASNPALKLYALDRLNKQMGQVSQTSFNTIDQANGIQKIRSVGRSNEFIFRPSNKQIAGHIGQSTAIIHSRQPSIHDQIVRDRPSIKFNYNNIQAVYSDRPRPVSNSPMIGLHGLGGRVPVSAGTIPSRHNEPVRHERSYIEHSIQVELPPTRNTRHLRREQVTILPPSGLPFVSLPTKNISNHFQRNSN